MAWLAAAAGAVRATKVRTPKGETHDRSSRSPPDDPDRLGHPDSGTLFPGCDGHCAGAMGRRHPGLAWHCIPVVFVIRFRNEIQTAQRLSNRVLARDRCLEAGFSVFDIDYTVSMLSRMLLPGR